MLRPDLKCCNLNLNPHIRITTINIVTKRSGTFAVTLYNNVNEPNDCTKLSLL